MGEKIIYYPPAENLAENPEKKQSAKDYEKRHLAEERGYTPSIEDSPKKFKESKPSRISEEEATEAVKEMDKARQESRGLKTRELKDWWFGVGQGEGAKQFAEWVFENLFIMYNRWERRQMAAADSKKKKFRDFMVKEGEEFKDDNVEPHIKRLAEEVVLHGGQEDILLYFTDEWRNGVTKPEVSPEARQKIWEVWNEYLKETSKDLAAKEKKDNN